MFGTMGFSELIIILVIVFIIFGAGRLPQIGEGVGKALKGFRKEVNDVPQPNTDQPLQETPLQQPDQISPIVSTAPVATSTATSPTPTKTNAPYVPGPELTPGTTASFLYNTSTQTSPTSIAHSQPPASSQPSQVISLEERAASPVPISQAAYPPLPAGAQTKPATKRPSAIVNREGVARIQAQQAALRSTASPSTSGVSPDDLQNLGEGLGEVVRTFRQTVTDIRSNVEPQMRTIQTEVDAAQKEIQQSIEAAKEPPTVQDESSKPS
ncbi:MAG: twin-arginine translocase TatA/TatE family subunit [Nitrospira sp.]|nr:twin-arginine translocase TatA/TatE family subunit [Nitrospira sp.]